MSRKRKRTEIVHRIYSSWNQHNDTHSLAYAAGGLGPNLYILNHDTVMKAVDSDKFEISMAEELDKMWENKIYETIKKKDVREGHSILRSVWSHRRKTTPDGNIYRHRSRLCADESTKNTA